MRPTFNCYPVIALATLALPIATAQIQSKSASFSRRDEPILPPKVSIDYTYLPAQIGAIVGAYAVSLVFVAITLLLLTKKRRQHLHAGDDEVDFVDIGGYSLSNLQAAKVTALESAIDITQARNAAFAFTSPIRATFSVPPVETRLPSSETAAPGTSPLVDQKIVFADHAMAQSQLEEMYRHVMEHEDAKERGVAAEAAVSSDHSATASTHTTVSSASTLPRKERQKPSSLRLDEARDDGKQTSKGSSLFAALKSPRKKPAKAVNISAPIMTPQTSTFPRTEALERENVPPKEFPTLLSPPPVPSKTQYTPYQPKSVAVQAIAPQSTSPGGALSIDERLGSQLRLDDTSRESVHASYEAEPASAVSEHSQAPLVGLPASPRRPSGRFPSLPLSPKPGATFSRTNAPSAVRTGGALPLRSYEPAMNSPTMIAHTTKQTVFERKGPLSPGMLTAKTPGTAMPYSPYQPFTPCMPMTPSLVTREDRKRMKRLMPKTPTLEMVKSEDDVW